MWVCVRARACACVHTAPLLFFLLCPHGASDAGGPAFARQSSCQRAEVERAGVIAHHRSREHVLLLVQTLRQGSTYARPPPLHCLVLGCSRTLTHSHNSRPCFMFILLAVVVCSDSGAVSDSYKHASYRRVCVRGREYGRLACLTFIALTCFRKLSHVLSICIQSWKQRLHNFSRPHVWSNIGCPMSVGHDDPRTRNPRGFFLSPSPYDCCDAPCLTVCPHCAQPLVRCTLG